MKTLFKTIKSFLWLLKLHLKIIHKLPPWSLIEFVKPNIVYTFDHATVTSKSALTMISQDQWMLSLHPSHWHCNKSTHFSRDLHPMTMQTICLAQPQLLPGTQDQLTAPSLQQSTMEGIISTNWAGEASQRAGRGYRQTSVYTVMFEVAFTV